MIPISISTGRLHRMIRSQPPDRGDAGQGPENRSDACPARRETRTLSIPNNMRMRRAPVSDGHVRRSPGSLPTPEAPGKARSRTLGLSIISSDTRLLRGVPAPWQFGSPPTTASRRGTKPTTTDGRPLLTSSIPGMLTSTRKDVPSKFEGHGGGPDQGPKGDSFVMQFCRTNPMAICNDYSGSSIPLSRPLRTREFRTNRIHIV